MFEHAVAFGEMIYGEKLNLDGIKGCTMTCLALETVPSPSL